MFNIEAIGVPFFLPEYVNLLQTSAVLEVQYNLLLYERGCSGSEPGPESAPAELNGPHI
jgi:hypothetical protein